MLKLSNLPPGIYSIHHAPSLVGTCAFPAVVCPDKRCIHRNETTCHDEFYDKKKQREKQTEIIHEIKQLRFEKDRIRLFRETFLVRCTRQSRKVMWVVLNSLFFRELCKNEKRGHGGMFPGAEEKQQK